MKTSKVLGGTATSFDRVASLYQVCEGFGAPDVGGLLLSLTPAMQCAIIAAVAVWRGPVVNKGVSLGCKAGGIVSALQNGNWLGTAKSVGCGYFSDIFATSAGIFAAGATAETGPGAAAVGVNTYRALLAGMKLMCGGVLTGAATQLGIKLEAKHETAVALDIIRRGKCLRETKRSVVGIQWSAVTCGTSASMQDATDSFGDLVAKRFGSRVGYWRCSPVEYSITKLLCSAEVHRGTRYLLISAWVPAPPTPPLFTDVRSRAWIRGWIRLPSRFVRSFQARGTASANGPAFDWAFLIGEAYDGWMRGLLPASYTAVDGNASGLPPPIFQFRCERGGPVVTCANRLGDTLRLTPSRRAGTSTGSSRVSIWKPWILVYAKRTYPGVAVSYRLSGCGTDNPSGTSISCSVSIWNSKIGRNDFCEQFDLIAVVAGRVSVFDPSPTTHKLVKGSRSPCV